MQFRWRRVNLRDVSYGGENSRATVIWVATSRARHTKVRREERTQRGWRNRDPQEQAAKIGSGQLLWRIDRLFAVLRLAGRKIRDWLAAVRNATSGRDASRVDRRHSAGLGEPRIPAITIVLVQQSWYRRCWQTLIQYEEVEKYKSSVSFSRMFE